MIGTPELLVILLFVAVGGALGHWKNRLAFGLIVSLLLGPIGWVVVLVMPNNRPKCPDCKGDIVAGARRCKNCGSVLAA